MIKGLVIGKFMPLHNGHIKLLEFALERCDELTIAMVVKPCDSIAPEIRTMWLEDFKTRASKPIVIDVVDEPLPKTHGIVPEAAQVWTAYFSERYRGIQRIFSSEQYGHMLAEAMGIEHWFYDEARLTTQISGSEIRLNPEKHLSYLPQIVQNYYKSAHRLEIFKVDAKGLSTPTKTIRVYLPPHYEDNVEQYYPVLYMHDAQNLFDPKTSAYGGIWNVQGAINDLIKEKSWPGLIVVGIDCAEGLARLDEYSPWINDSIRKMEAFKDINRDVGGLGDAYADFIVKMLKPLIDERFRTLKVKEATGIMGSSMGGVISLYTAAKYQNVFSKVGALSTAAWFAEDALNDCLAKMASNDNYWYLSVGTNETSNIESDNMNQRYLKGTLRLAETLAIHARHEDQVMTVIDEGAIHHESAWQARLPEAITHLYQL